MNTDAKAKTLPDSEMRTFESIVRDYAAAKTNEGISNATMNHAYIGIRYLLKNANGVVKIFNKDMYARFWSKLESDIKEFLATATNKIEVVTTDSVKDNKLVKLLRENYPSQIKFLQLKSDNVKKGHAPQAFPHFLVIQPFGYRFEISDKEKQKSLVKGIINFGDEDGSRSLTKAFDLLKTKATTITIAG